MGLRKIPILSGFLALGSVAVLSAHYTWEQIDYLYGQLSPKTLAPNSAPVWTADEAGLPALKAQVKQLSPGESAKASYANYASTDEHSTR